MLPTWRDGNSSAIRRSDVAALLDDVEDHHGPRQADYVLTVVRRIMNWYATRHDDYTPPIVRGMRRQNPGAQARARILTMTRYEPSGGRPRAAGTFGGNRAHVPADRAAQPQGRGDALAGYFESTANGRCRRSRARRIPAGSLCCPRLALAIIRAQPPLGGNPYVFAGRGDGPYRGFSPAKLAFDSQAPPESAPWMIHDLRRDGALVDEPRRRATGHAERVMGHAIAGVEGVYDRHSYRDEKADALARLAALIETIINPRAENVVALAKPRKRR